MKEKLIDLVFNCPALWDRRNKQHHNRHVLTREWKRISAKLELSEVEVRNCWKNLRQEYGKQLLKCETRSGNAGSEDNAVCQWSYFQSLQFLRDQFTPRTTISNSEENHSKSSPTYSADNYLEIKEDGLLMPSTPTSAELVSSPLTNDIKPSAPQVPAVTPSSSCASPFSECNVSKSGYKRRNTPQTEIEKQLLELERERLALKKESHEHNDEEVGFFNSLLPTVKKLTQKDKFIFRMKVQQTLYELAFHEEPPAKK